MQKDLIIQKLKEAGCRITKQRRMILDIILEEDCSCCKEIYYKVSKRDSGIGAATVYRMVNTLEEIGAISRKNMYRIDCNPECKEAHGCQVEFEDGTVLTLPPSQWKKIIESGLRLHGYTDAHTVCKVSVRDCC